MEWFDDDWEYRKKITIDGGYVGVGGLSNFPVYLNLAHLGSDFFDRVKADGGDIRITTADGETEVAVEIVSINTSGETGEVWFKAPTLAYSANTDFYIYFGNPSASLPAASSTYGSQNVWGDWLGVYPLKESSGTRVDSTSNAFNLSQNNTVGNDTGVIGNAADFGSANSVNSLSIDNNLGILGGICSISFWVKLNSEIESGVFRFFEINNNTDHVSFTVDYQYNSGNRRLLWRRDKTGAAATDFVELDGALGTSNFYKIDLDYDGTTLRGYVNGAFVGDVAASGNGSPQSSTNRFVLGLGRALSNNPASIDIDNFRIRNTTRTYEQIETEYNNQSTPGDFYAIGELESFFTPPAEPSTQELTISLSSPTIQIVQTVTPDPIEMSLTLNTPRVLVLGYLDKYTPQGTEWDSKYVKQNIDWTDKY